MKINKIIISLLILSFFIPFVVSAEDVCNPTDVKIKGVEFLESHGNAEEVSDISTTGNDLNLNLKMHNVGDSIEYTIKVENTSTEDFFFDERSLKKNTNYLEYVFSYDDGSNIIKAGEEKIINLKIEYKNEVPNNLLVNNSIDDNNVMNINLSNKQFVSVADTLKNETFVKVLCIVLIVVGSILIAVRLKKTSGNMIIIILVLFMIPNIVLAICKSSIEVVSNVKIEPKDTLYESLISSNSNGCLTKYDGKISDELNKTVDATNVYINKCNTRNVIFANYCWQLIRTNETGGIRLEYNGEPVNGKCESNRPDHLGVVGSDFTTVALTDSYSYSSLFNYNLDTKVFELVNPETYTWSEDTYTNMLGKYTCLSEGNSCTTLYNINGYRNATTADATTYTIGDIGYAVVGSSVYNQTYGLSMLGYMYHYVYNVNTKSMNTTEYLYGHSFVYDEDEDMYTLSGETQVVGDWETGYDKLTNTHYTCFNTTGTCKDIYYIVNTSKELYGSSYKMAYYATLTGGESIEDVINKSYNVDDLNYYDSTMKVYVENWYRHNMLNYTDKLEDSVYCSDTGVLDLGGWDPSKSTVYPSILKFRYRTDYYNLSCPNTLYQFTTTNNKAKLRYPVSIISANEHNLLSKDDNTFVATGSSQWETPAYNFYDAQGRGISYSTLWYYPATMKSNGVRPLISLKPDTLISSGTGTETDPWIVE